MTVLRFDKAYSGRNPGLPIVDLTLDTYRDEAAAASTSSAPEPRSIPRGSSSRDTAKAASTRPVWLKWPPIGFAA